MEGITILAAFILGAALFGVVLEKRRIGTWKQAFDEVFTSVTFWGMVALAVLVLVIYFLSL